LYIEGGEPVFGFRELVCFKVMKDLRDKGITPRRMRNYLDQLKRILPESERPLTSIDGRRHGILWPLVSEERNDPEGAIAEYRHLLELDPRDADAMVNLGNVYYGIGKVEKARQWYLEALMMDPEHVEGNYNFANLLDEQGEVQTAILFYLRSIRNETTFADAYFNVAVCFHKLGKFDEAKTYFKSYLRFDSTSEWAKIALELLNSY
jgi:tetratricopeptide (TPR) repeat protein